MTTVLPVGIQAFSERLDFSYIGPRKIGRFECFLVDLADLKLSLTDRTPSIWVRDAETLALDVVDLADEITDLVRQEKWHNDVVLILLEKSIDDLSARLNENFTALVLDDKQQKKIYEAHSASRVAIDFFIKQISRLRLAPYETSRPVTGSRFFGRRVFLNQVINHPDKNYLVTGVRRIGKTSLLHEIKRRLDRKDPTLPHQTRRIYIDCSVLTSETEFYREIIYRLNPAGLKQLERDTRSRRYQSQVFEHLAALHGGTVTFLLDEIDWLLEILGTDSEFFNVLRRASAQNAARFIMAGFRFSEQAASDIKTPFFNLGQLLRLKAFEREDVKQIVDFPMGQLRVTLEGHAEIIKEIFRETSGLPNLVQFYCQTLLEGLESSGGDSIRVEDLQSVCGSAPFRDFVIQTFMSNATPAERAIVFAMTAATPKRTQFSIEDIDNELSRRDLNLSFNNLDEACNNLERAGYFAKRDTDLSFTVPLFARMLEDNYPLEFAFKKARRECLESHPTS